MIQSKELIRYIVNKIANCSRYYTAEVTATPRLYHVRSGTSLNRKYADGIIITRFADAHFLPMHGFIFEPDIVKYVNRVARKDKDFALRLKNINLNPDDIETLVRKLTFDKIMPCMRGRRNLSG